MDVERLPSGSLSFSGRRRAKDRLRRLRSAVTTTEMIVEAIVTAGSIGKSRRLRKQVDAVVVRCRFCAAAGEDRGDCNQRKGRCLPGRCKHGRFSIGRFAGGHRLEGPPALHPYTAGRHRNGGREPRISLTERAWLRLRAAERCESASKRCAYCPRAIRGPFLFQRLNLASRLVRKTSAMAMQPRIIEQHRQVP